MADKKLSPLSITLMSFGFKHGLPEEANIVLDVRFLQNPFWVPELKNKTGQDEEVGAYIQKDPEFEGFLKRLQSLIEPLLSKYTDEEDGNFTIAIGCTGGRHRSVYTAERLAQWLEEQSIALTLEHRDLERID